MIKNKSSKAQGTTINPQFVLAKPPVRRPVLSGLYLLCMENLVAPRRALCQPSIPPPPKKKPSGERLRPITDVLASPVTNELAMEWQLLAEMANYIIGTGQVLRAGGNSTPSNGTAWERGEGVARARQAGATCVSVCV